MVTRDYRKCDLVEPVVKPVTMTIEEVQGMLFLGSCIGKMAQFHEMPSLRQDFMKSLVRLLMEHSYLKDQMARLACPHATAGSGDSAG